MKTILVTGSTDGIGKATAIALARLGHRVIVHGRNQPRVQAAVAEVRSAVPGAAPLAVSFDLGRLASVRTGAADVLGLLAGAPLHVLINNAGIFASEREVTGDGNELSFQVNHLAAVLLTELLMPALLAAAPGRVINVASIAHTRGELHRGDLTLASSFTGYAAYAQSKLANVLHARALAAAYEPPRLLAYSLHRA
ncbi:MAG: SDR family NAD(P)-dependent oxidoreductase [Myxococcales bacterium]|nr:SDR family NAD(P)-dependent oxidoreductase [Myxococcales bacterium]